MTKLPVKIIRLFVMLAILPLSLWNCDGGTDCDEFEDSYFYIEEEAKDLFPYNGNETLTYLYTTPSDTDTLVFAGKDLETGFYEKTSLHPVCPQGDSEFYEYAKYRFGDEEKGQSFVVENAKRNLSKRTNNKFIFDFDSISCFVEYAQIKYETPPKQWYKRIYNYSYADSLLNSVVEITWTQSTTTDFTYPVKIIYHRDLGLVVATNTESNISYKLLSSQ